MKTLDDLDKDTEALEIIRKLRERGYTGAAVAAAMKRYELRQTLERIAPLVGARLQDDCHNAAIRSLSASPSPAIGQEK